MAWWKTQMDDQNQNAQNNSQEEVEEQSGKPKSVRENIGSVD